MCSIPSRSAKVVCIITGGNLELRILVDILMDQDLAIPVDD